MPYTPWAIAIRTVSRTSAKAGSCRWQWVSMIIGASVPGHHHPPDQERRRDGAVAQDQVVADAFDRREHLEQIAGHRHLFDRIRELAVLDPEPGRAPRIVAGHAVDAEADQL